jgi:hypothetical protein
MCSWTDRDTTRGKEENGSVMAGHDCRSATGNAQQGGADERIDLPSNRNEGQVFSISKNRGDRGSWVATIRPMSSQLNALLRDW